MKKYWIFSADRGYYLEEDEQGSVILVEDIEDRIKELEKEFDNTDSIYSATGLIARIDELKNLLKNGN